MSWLTGIFGGKAASRGSARASGADGMPGVHLIIDRRTLPVAELGLRSFRVRPYDGDLIQRQNFSFGLIFSHEGEEYHIHGRGRVLRVSEKDGLVAQFDAPQPFLERKLIEFLTRYVRTSRS